MQDEILIGNSEGSEVLTLATSTFKTCPEFVTVVERSKQVKESRMDVLEHACAVMWHWHLAHFSYGGLTKMVRSSMEGLPVSRTDFRAAARQSCDVGAPVVRGQSRGPHRDCLRPCACGRVPHVWTCWTVVTFAWDCAWDICTCLSEPTVTVDSAFQDH